MQEEILKLYEKIQNQLSQEEFLAEMQQERENYKDVEFMDDVLIAREVLKNHGVTDFETDSAETDSSEDVPFEVSFESDEEESTESAIVMTDDLLENIIK